MWKSFFLAIGIFTLVFGVECLGVEKMLLKARNAPPASPVPWPSTEPRLGPNKEFTPPSWVPWSLISTGAVTCIYSFTIPKRMGK